MLHRVLFWQHYYLMATVYIYTFIFKRNCCRAWLTSNCANNIVSYFAHIFVSVLYLQLGSIFRTGDFTCRWNLKMKINK